MMRFERSQLALVDNDFRDEDLEDEIYSSDFCVANKDAHANSKYHDGQFLVTYIKHGLESRSCSKFRSSSYYRDARKKS